VKSVAGGAKPDNWIVLTYAPPAAGTKLTGKHAQWNSCGRILCWSSSH